MNITLNKPFASNAPVDGSDVRAVKIVLNRLGFYPPVKKIGITDIPDAAVFDALKAFQNDKGLKPTGEIRQGDETLKALNEDIERTKSDQYIWVTVGDNAVRDSHQELHGQIRSFDEEPTPGSEPNCRCSAVLVPSKKPDKKPDCEEERKAYKQAVDDFQNLNQRKAEIERELNDLNQKLKSIEDNVGKNWIVTGLTGVLPGVTGALVGNIVENEAAKVQSELGRIKKGLLLRKDYLAGQLKLIDSQWSKAKQNVLQTKQKLETCMKK